MTRLRPPGFWGVATAIAVLAMIILLIIPVANVLLISMFERKSGELGFGNYIELFTTRFYTGAIMNTLTIGLFGTLGACFLGVPLAFFTARYRVCGRSVILTLSVLVMCSPPFIGAYAWIMLFGGEGVVTATLRGWGIPSPTIYGIPGISLVFAIQFFPYMFLMTEGAIASVNSSLEDAAENLGCTGFSRFRKVTLPLVLPAVSTGSIICFVLSIADFGTPSILGRGIRTLSTIAYSQYTSEMGGTPTMAVTISMLLIFVSTAALLIQRRILARRRFASALLNGPVKQILKGWRKPVVHAFCYGVVAFASLPAVTVAHTSFLATDGPVFVGGFSADSYRNVLNGSLTGIINSFTFALAAVVLIALMSGFLSFIVVRRNTAIAGTLDLLLMMPYLIPGVVMAIGYVATFRHPPFDLTGTAGIIILLVFTRRLPYGVRSTISILRQIKPSIEEAAASLGASQLRIFLKVTLPLMRPGLLIGSLMSFITAINELSSTLILYTPRTVTMPVLIYTQVIDGEFGRAAALSTMLLASTGLCVFTVLRLSENKEAAFV